MGNLVKGYGFKKLQLIQLISSCLSFIFSWISSHLKKLLLIIAKQDFFVHTFMKVFMQPHPSSGPFHTDIMSITLVSRLLIPHINTNVSLVDFNRCHASSTDISGNNCTSSISKHRSHLSFSLVLRQ